MSIKIAMILVVFVKAKFIGYHNCDLFFEFTKGKMDRGLHSEWGPEITNKGPLEALIVMEPDHFYLLHFLCL